METITSKIELQIFARNVAWLRNHHGFSKKKMAQLLGIGTASLNRIERGDIPTGLGIGIFFHIHKHFGICPADQLTRKLWETEPAQ